MMGIPVDTLSFAMNVFRGIPELSEDDREGLREAEKEARGAGARVEDMKGWVERVADMVVNVLEGVQGIGFNVDKEIGTDRTVFGIHGPNMGNYGKAEVGIVFKEEVGRHPDFFLTPVAAMGYYRGWYVKNSRVGTDRPWVGKDAKAWGDGGEEAYRKSVFQCGTQGWTEGCAMEWIARVVQNGKTGAGPAKAAQEVSLEDVQALWKVSDPHAVLEAHLPGFVPLGAVERVYVQKGVEGAAEACEALEKAGVECSVVDNTKDAVWELMTSATATAATTTTTATTGQDKDRSGEEGGGGSGYDFFVSGNGEECCVPVDLTVAGAKSVGFCAVSGGVSGDLMVTLSDKPSGSDKRRCVTFKIPAFDQNAYAYNVPPKDINKDGIEADRVGKGVNFNLCAAGTVTWF